MSEAPGDGEAKTSAALASLDPLEPLENALLIGWVDSGPLVADIRPSDSHGPFNDK